VINSSAILDGRILRVDVCLRGQRLALFSVYAPDESYGDSTKLYFWNALSKALDSVGGNLKRFVGGDMNASIVAPDRACIGDVNHQLCYERCSETSFNGLELIALAKTHNLFVENTFFATSKACHQYTFQSSNATKYRRRLDYFLVDGYIHRHATNCRSYDPRISSDHRMVVLDDVLPSKATRLATRWKRRTVREIRPDFGCLAFDSDIQERYAVAVENKFSGLEVEDVPPATLAGLIVDELNSCAAAVLPELNRKKLKSPWITDGYIELREQFHGAGDAATRKRLKRSLDRLKTQLRNAHYSERAQYQSMPGGAEG